MTLVAFDLRHPELVAHELHEANRRLAREPEVPESILALVREVCEQIAETDSSELEAIDPYLWIDLQQTALRALGAITDEDPRDERRQVRIALEHGRFLLTRMAERQAVAEDRPISELVRWLDQVFAVPQRAKAELFGVAPRTYQRWIAGSDPTEPDGEDARLIRLVARITNQLRHSLGGLGVLDWLQQPRDELGGARPIEALREGTETEAVLSLAVGTRGSAAA